MTDTIACILLIFFLLAMFFPKQMGRAIRLWAKEFREGWNLK